MGGIFGGPSKPKFPPAQAPAALPQVGEEVEDIARRKRPRGRRETFLTGDLVPEARGKGVLG